MQTAFTELVGCRQPVQQAPMGGISGPALAAAVAAAGGLGMLCQYAAEPAASRIEATKRRADGGAVGMGFFGQWLGGDLETFELAAAQLHVVEIFWTKPTPATVERARRAGPARIGWQVGSVDDARAAAAAGCHFVVAQGVEAGGHVRGTTPRAELLEQVLSAVDIPVVTAGGITSAADVAGALAAGAAAVRVGTRFVATPESDAHPAYIDALLAARSGDTVLTTAYNVGWPDAPHRVLADALTTARNHDGDVVGEDGGQPTPKWSALPPQRSTTGAIQAMAMYAGCGVGGVTQIQLAADVVADLVREL